MTVNRSVAGGVVHQALCIGEQPGLGRRPPTILHVTKGVREPSLKHVELLRSHRVRRDVLWLVVPSVKGEQCLSCRRVASVQGFGVERAKLAVVMLRIGSRRLEDCVPHFLINYDDDDEEWVHMDDLQKTLHTRENCLCA